MYINKFLTKIRIINSKEIDITFILLKYYIYTLKADYSNGDKCNCLDIHSSLFQFNICSYIIEKAYYFTVLCYSSATTVIPVSLVEIYLYKVDVIEHTSIVHHIQIVKIQSKNII